MRISSESSRFWMIVLASIYYLFYDRYYLINKRITLHFTLILVFWLTHQIEVIKASTMFGKDKQSKKMWKICIFVIAWINKLFLFENFKTIDNTYKYGIFCKSFVIFKLTKNIFLETCLNNTLIKLLFWSEQQLQMFFLFFSLYILSLLQKCLKEDPPSRTH